MGASAVSFDSTSGFNLDVDTQHRVVSVVDTDDIPVVELRDVCALDENDMPDCMSELCLQLITLFIIKQFGMQVVETSLPYFWSWLDLAGDNYRPPETKPNGGARQKGPVSTFATTLRDDCDSSIVLDRLLVLLTGHLASY